MYYCIANPSARSGNRSDSLEKLLTILRKQGIPCRLYYSQGPAHARHLAEIISSLPRTAEDPVNLIVAGGDGTFNEVLNGIRNYENLRLGLLPAGSGNDLARGLGLPDDPDVIIRMIAEGKVRRHIDLGALRYHAISDVRTPGQSITKSASRKASKPSSRKAEKNSFRKAAKPSSRKAAESMTAPKASHAASSMDCCSSADQIAAGGLEHRFAISSGIGFDAAVCEEALSSNIKDFFNKFHLGKLSYGTIALRQILTAKKTACDITMDGGRSLHLDHLLFCAVMNCAFEGGGYRFAPDADPGDGEMTLIAVGDISRPKAILSFPAAHAGKYYDIKEVHHFRVRSAEIRTENPLWVHTDGEVFCKSRHISVTCLPGKAALIV